MALVDTLKKLTTEDRMALLVDVVILPTIEEDKLLSQDEREDIERAGLKLGFSSSDIEAAVHEQLRAQGAELES
jgi:hypothetical protein